MPMPSGSVAAILFLLGDPELRLPAEARESQIVINWFNQSAFRAVAMDAKPTVARKLLGRWLVSPGSMNMLNMRLHLAMQFQMPEAIDLARKLLSDDKAVAMNPHLRAQAVAVIGQIGGKSHAALLAPLWSDSTEMFRMGVAGSQQPRVCQVRDVALAWLLILTGEDPAEYGMAQAKDYFEQVQKMPAQHLLQLRRTWDTRTPASATRHWPSGRAGWRRSRCRRCPSARRQKSR